ncbi:MAG: serine hydrolase [Myxococcota bacterium]
MHRCALLTSILVSAGLCLCDRFALGSPPAERRIVISVGSKLNEDDLSLTDVPERETAFIDPTPDQRSDGVVVGELGVDGGNRTLIVDLAKEIADDKHGKYDSLLIAHKNKLVFESYFLRGRINMTHPQVSATKAYTSLAIGRAIQLGHLTMDDLNAPLTGFLKELNPKRFATGTERITLHQAMTMRSGLRITDEQHNEMEKRPQSLKGQQRVQAYLEQTAPIASESQSFEYQGADPNLVMQVLDAVVPGTAEDFIRKELFGKLGIETFSWQKDFSGLPIGGSRSSITSRAMVKLGALVFNDGNWDGEQLIPAAFIEKSLDRTVVTGDDEVFGGGKDVSKQGYGYYWWSAELNHDGKQHFASSAQGGGGQFIVVIDDYDLIVVTTAHQGKVSTLQMVAERILPAFDRTTATH